MATFTRIARYIHKDLSYYPSTVYVREDSPDSWGQEFDDSTYIPWVSLRKKRSIVLLLHFILTIKLPVVYMGRDVGSDLDAGRGPFEGVGVKSKLFVP
jgi:hypothetical protein